MYCINRHDTVICRHEFILSSQEREMVTRLGYLILDKINLGMRVFPTSLIAAVLLQNDEKCIEKSLYELKLY